MTLRPELNFEVLPTYDSRVLAIIDLSDWKHMKSESSFIDITLPASKSTITKDFAKEALTRFNSSNLAYGCTNCEDGLISLPDGIYKIKIYSCDGATFSEEKYYLRTVKLELRINKILVSLNLECGADSACINDIIKAELLLRGAKADLIFGNINAAKRKYEKSMEIIDDLEHCDCTKECGDGYTTAAY